MARDTSLQFKQAINGDEIADPFLMLVKIKHDSLGDDIRIVNNYEDITSNGDLYIASGFELSIPSETTETVQKLKFTINNVDANLTATIRSLSTAPTIEAFLVFASNPDVVEVGPYEMEFHNTTINKVFITTDLIVTPIDGDTYPEDKMDQTIFTNLK